jgi:UPF0755 protein
MTLDEHPAHYRSRTDRRRAERARRSRNNRIAKLTVAITLSVACLAAAGLFGWKIFNDRKKASSSREYKVVVPEGLNIKQTADKVKSQCKISAVEFTNATNEGGYIYSFLKDAGGNLEGFLFPKTYTVTAKTSARDLVDMMLTQYQKEMKGLDWARAGARKMSAYQTLIIASLIEKEARLPEERPVIASVIYNRLNAAMKLQIDATVQYALGKWKQALSYKDLEVDSPYNTYKIDGLPPAPICSPGFESIRAALYPATTDYRYYILTSPEGRHSFTNDYQQFLKWKDEQNKKS